MMPKTVLWMSAILMVVGPTTLHAQEVKNLSFKTSQGERVLRLETTVKCSLDQAWELYTTTDGLKSWMAPVVEVDFSNGGLWEASYDKNKKIGDPGNIVNEIICIVPKEMFVLRVRKVPDDFPFDEKLIYKARSVHQFEKVGKKRTKVTMTGTPYGEGPEWNRLYNFFVWANRYTFLELHKRIENGPVDWEKKDLSEVTSP